MGSHQQWWAKVRGNVRGPLSAIELKELAAHGTIHSETPVSCDGQRWLPAGRVRGLETQSRPDTTGSNADAAPSPFAADDDSDAMSIAVAAGDSTALWVGGAIAGVVLLFVVLAAVGLSFLMTEEAGAPEPDQPSEQQIAFEATWNYWSAIVAMSKSTPPADASALAWAEFADSMAVGIEALPTVNVDIEAVECGLNVAAAMRLIADRARSREDPALMVESFLRGMSGDVLGPALEQQELDRQATTQAKAVQQQCITTRAVLTARYGVEFPPL